VYTVDGNCSIRTDDAMDEDELNPYYALWAALLVAAVVVVEIELDSVVETG
jgi:hypothetical protein